MIDAIVNFWLGLNSDRNRNIFHALMAVAAFSGFAIGWFWSARRIGQRILDWRFTGFQNNGEALVSGLLLSNFGAPDYHLLNHITLQLPDGTTQIDHILVSRFGVFVIETKHFGGLIFAKPADEEWTQVRFKRSFEFQSPIFQNRRHLRAVERALAFLPPQTIRSLVVFSGDAEFMTPLPYGVTKIGQLTHYLRQQREEVISFDQLQMCVGRLETARLAISGRTDVEHIEDLARRHGEGAPHGS